MKKFLITFKGQQYELGVEEISNTAVGATAVASPKPTLQNEPAKSESSPKPAVVPKSSGARAISAPMPGKILAVNVKNGETVKRGDVLFILEAMKMQNEIMAPHDGNISNINVSIGQSVATGDQLAAFG
ncbi:biotin/lipoyl-binding protein [bacterium BFN5]|nr:biotin/lipoyl-binding protein [bacterium BFN5]QJW46266.1 biotin/lipoyl-binding protein [bacterium BFN5]